MSANTQTYSLGSELVKKLRTTKKAEEFKQILIEFKQCVLTLPFIFTSPSTSTEKKECVRHRLLAIDGYEAAVRFYASQNTEAADIELRTHLALLKPLYFDKILKNGMAKSKSRLEIICLDLLNSLVSQRFREFYCLYEQLTVEERNSDTVQFVSMIEQSLMAGNYGTLLKISSGKNIKGYSKLFKKGVEKLEGTVQNEVALCLEKAYTNVSQKDAVKLLRNDGKSGSIKLPDAWNIVNGEISFQTDEDALEKEVKITAELSGQVIEESVGYAKELEKIV